MNGHIDFRSLRQIAGTAILAIFLVLLLSEMVTDYLVMAGVILVATVLFLFPDEASAEKRRRKTARDSARYLWDLWYKKWVAEAGDRRLVQ